MASATFGRKGMAGGETAPARRNAAFLKPTAPAPREKQTDPLAMARNAFLAAERSRARDADEDGGEVASPSGLRGPTVIVSGKSLGTAYVLWLFLGGFSAHRFYLNSPLTAIAQVCLWYVGLMFFMAGHAGAFYALGAGALWISADAVLMPRLRDAANEKLRRRAEMLRPEPV